VGGEGEGTVKVVVCRERGEQPMKCGFDMVGGGSLGGGLLLKSA